MNGTAKDHSTHLTGTAGGGGFLLGVKTEGVHIPHKIFSEQKGDTASLGCPLFVFLLIYG